MKTSSDVLGKPVIGLNEGIQLGTVEDLLFSEDQSHVLGFLLKTGWLAEPMFVPFADIDAFGRSSQRSARAIAFEQRTGYLEGCSTAFSSIG